MRDFVEGAFASLVAFSLTAGDFPLQARNNIQEPKREKNNILIQFWLLSQSVKPFCQ